MDFGQMLIDPNSLESFNTAWKLFDAATYGGNFTSMNVTGAAGAYGNLNGPWTLEDGVWVSPIINNDAGNQYFAFDQSTGELVVVPEPSTIVFAALGATISGIHCINKRRRHKRDVAA
jgi:outer membrane protein assembly factor BamB